MKRLFILFAIVISAYSCQSTSTDTESTKDSILDKAPSLSDSISTSNTSPSNGAAQQFCYQFTIGKDVYDISYTLAPNNTVKGTAHYDNFEKDDSHGTIEGTFDPQKNIVHVWYSFEAEGMHSVAEKYFKIEGNTLTPGFGDMDQTGDSAVFKDASKLTYSPQFAYQKVVCK